MLQTISQTFCTVAEYQLIYNSNPMKFRFLKHIKTGHIFYVANVHSVFFVEVCVSHEIVQLLYTKIYWCSEVVLELRHRKYRPRKHFASVEVSFY